MIFSKKVYLYLFMQSAVYEMTTLDSPREACYISSSILISLFFSHTLYHNCSFPSLIYC